MEMFVAMQTRHTPGPWHYGATSNAIITPRGQLIADLNDRQDDVEQMEADARLIAEAPAMREVLEMILHNEEPLGDGYARVCTLDMEAARALLAHIDGRER